MNAARYWVALVTTMSLVPAIGLWFLIHPFAPFWRRRRLWVTWLALGAGTVAFMAPVFLLRHRLLAVDLGTNPVTVALAVVALVLGGAMALKRRRLLTYRILVGLPEISAEAYPGKLLTEGIYRKIRHPRYVEVALWVLAYALFANYLALYVASLLTVPALLLIVAMEERELEERFGEEWRSYAATTPRFLPRRRRSGGENRT